MSKTIKQFRQEPYGFFVDLDDAEAAVAVNPRTGEILLDEGIGEDRFDGAAISAGSFHEFALEPETGDEVRLVLRFGHGKSHVLGTTRKSAEASQWVQAASEAIMAISGESKATSL